MSEQAAGAQRPATAGGTRPRSTARVSETAQLQDRLHSVLHRQAEAKQNALRTIAERRRTARALHDENVALRNIISAEVARIEHVGCPARSGMPADITEAECDQLRLRIHLARRRCNRLDYEVASLERQLERSAEQQRWLHDAVAQPYAAATAGAQRSTGLRIRALERRLDETLRTQGLVRTIVEQYAMHAQALEAEGKAYDAQTQALEREYVDRHRDHLQLATLYGNARRALEAVLRRRHACLRRMSHHRAEEEAALAEKKASVDAALAITQRIELQQRTELQQQLEEEAQMLQAAEAKRAQLEQSQRQRRSTLSSLPAALLAPAMAELFGSSHNNRNNRKGEASEADAELHVYEKALHTLLVAAKVSSKEELIKAFEEQAARHRYMKEELQAKREKCAALEQLVRQLRARQQTERYNTPALMMMTTHRQEGKDGCDGQPQSDMAAHSRLMMSEMREFMAKTERTWRALTRQNAQDEAALQEALRRLSALVALTAPYRPDVPLPSSFAYPAMPPHDEEGTAEEDRSSSTRRDKKAERRKSSADALAMQELRMHLSVLAHKLISLADDSARVQQHELEEEAQSRAAAARSVVPYSAPMVIPAHNLRIALPSPQHSHNTYNKSLTLTRHAAATAAAAADLDLSSASLAGAAESSALFSIEGTGLAAENDVADLNSTTSSQATSERTAMAAAASYRESSPGLGRRASLSHATTPKSRRDGPLAVGAGRRRRRGRAGRRDSLTAPDADLSEDPLQREEIKKMSATIMLREKKRRQRELAQGTGKGVL